MELEKVKGNSHTGAAAGAEEVEQVAEPLHLQIEVHPPVADVETPVAEEVRAERRGAAHREVGPAREVLRAPPAQIRPREREPHRVRCNRTRNPELPNFKSALLLLRRIN